MRCLSCLLLLAVLGLGACQGQSTAPGARDTGPGWDIGELPTAPRHASATSVVNGADYDAAGDGATVAGTALMLSGAGLDYSWARYAFSVPAGEFVRSLSLDVQDVSSEYWVGLSNYTRGVWEWHGPYNVSDSPVLHQPRTDYVSPGGVFYWVVLSVRGHDLQLNTSTVVSAVRELYPSSPGNYTIVSGNCTAPVLVHLPQIEPNVVEGAPLIAYIHYEGADPKLNFAYSTFGGWTTLPVLPAHNFWRPELRWLGTEGIITAYDLTDSALVDIRFDSELNIKSSTTIMAGPGIGLVNQSLDVTAGGELGLAQAYADATTGQLYFSTNDGTGWQNSAALYSGDPVAGLCFRYDPLGGDPWLMFCHGTVDTSSSVIIRFTLEEGRQSGGTWNFTPLDYPDAPLSADLNFDVDGAPQLCFLAARDYTLNNPFVTYTGTLLYDAVVATKSGAAWDTTKVYTSTISPHYSFPNDYITFSVAAASEVRWATLKQLSYASITGDVDINIASQQPTGGTLSPGVQYMIGETGTYLNDDRFGGLPGSNFSWSPCVDTVPAAAYITRDAVDPLALFSGQVDQASDLLYWRGLFVFPG